MKTISFTNDTKMVCVVDDVDYKRMCRYKWHVTHNYNGTLHYASRSFTIASRSKKPKPCRISKTISMHRQLMKPGRWLVVDHIDGNGLNNQRCNLRVVTTRQNLINRHRPQRHALHGVSQSTTGRWYAQICVGGIHYNLGQYDTEQIASDVYMKHTRIADYVQSLMK